MIAKLLSNRKSAGRWSKEFFGTNFAYTGLLDTISSGKYDRCICSSLCSHSLAAINFIFACVDNQTCYCSLDFIVLVVSYIEMFVFTNVALFCINLLINVFGFEYGQPDKGD